jgi:uncharacterized protein with NAD-binding domain and iron-sulfur cluster
VGGSGGLTRRRLLQTGAATVAATAVPWGARARAGRRPTVAVFGGGIAGLTAAHELAGRGFAVTLYEARAWGGKARSTQMPGTATDGRLPLPGEHGWRTFFGFYQNTVESFRRIPSPAGGTVFDHLVGANDHVLARDGGRRDLLVPLSAPEPGDLAPDRIVDTLTGAALELDLPPEAAAHLARRMLVFLSSCDARRHGQWETTTWEDFSGAARFSDDYRHVVGAFSEVVQASKSSITAARFSALVLELVLYNAAGVNSNGPVFRFLDAPTNEALIDPWLAELGRLGVDLRLGDALTRIVARDGRIAGCEVTRGGRPRRVEADFYVCALPVERARRLWSRDVLRLDPSLAAMNELSTGWMNGIKLFLREEVPVSRGIVVYLDSPWLLTSVSQAQLWPASFAERYGDGQTRESFSVIISDWFTPGRTGRAASECTPEQLIDEIWAQIEDHLNNGNRMLLRRDLLHTYEIDPGMRLQDGRLVSEDPLVLPAAGERRHRPRRRHAHPEPLPRGRLPAQRVGGREHGERELQRAPCGQRDPRPLRQHGVPRAGDRALPAARVGGAQAGRRRPRGERTAEPVRRGRPHPRPMNGIFVAITVRNWTLASSGSPAM